jgi:hypothetical protein
MADSFRVIAIIAAFNEGDIISAVIGHLVENDIDVYLIDNRSTDDTVEQASKWLGRGLLHIEEFPQGVSTDPESPSFFDWTSILHRKEEVASQLPADWILHHDADEIRESPWPGINLKEAIRWVDHLGYNCIDFRVFNFPATNDGFKQGDDPKAYFTLCEDVSDFDKEQLKCWKAGETRVSLVPSGGHEVCFEGRRVFPVQFLLRHYPIRGQRHGVKKVFAERKNRFLQSERSKGWHIQYDQIKDETYTFLVEPASLRPFALDDVRLDLMLPGEALRNLTDRLTRTDGALATLRLQGMGLEQGLAEYKSHANNLEQVRKELLQRVANLEPERDQLRQQVVHLERGLDEYKQHATGLERVREELLQRVANLELEREEVRQQVIQLERTVDEYKQQARHLETVRQDLEQNNRTLEQETGGIRNSRSWRWTAPLRRLFDTFSW